MNEFIRNYSIKLKECQAFNDRKVLVDTFYAYFQDFLRLINSLTTVTSHSTIYKSYLLASNIVRHMSIYLHSRGKSDSLFAKIIDKMILPVGLINKSANQPNSNNKMVANIATSNNQNSILMSLKDTLHTFLSGIKNLNYEYDGYLQRVLQNIIASYSMKFQMVQMDDHFLMLAIESSFTKDPSQECIQFRSYLLKLFKQSFLIDSKSNTDIEKCLSVLTYIVNKTETSQVVLKDVDTFFSSVLLLMSHENNALRTKALSLLNVYLGVVKKIDDEPIDNPNEIKQIYSQSIENLIKTHWSKVEPNKLFISLNLIAKQKPDLITGSLKELIIEKVQESQSKFRYNAELKNILFTFFEYLDGDQGKVYLNERLATLWY